MAKLGLSTGGFKPQEHDTEQRGDYTDLPDGIYKLEISTAEPKVTDPDSPRTRKVTLKTTYDVLEPEEYKGRKLFGNYNLENPSADAQRIGQAQFASLCRALEIDHEVDDTDELMFKAFTAKVGMGKPSKDKNPDGTPVYPAKNEIKRFFFPDSDDVPQPEITGPVRPANDNKAAGKPAANQNAPAAAAKPAGNKPWGAKK